MITHYETLRALAEGETMYYARHHFALKALLPLARRMAEHIADCGEYQAEMDLLSDARAAGLLNEEVAP